MKPRAFQFGLLVRVAGLSLLLSGAAAVGWAQAIRLDAVPTGLRPLGIDISVFSTTPDAVAAVANSGDNSVSVFRLAQSRTLTPLITIGGIPGPYSIAACPAQGSNQGMMLVTSPSDSSVRVLEVPDGKVVRTVSVGTSPYSVACFVGQGLSVLQGSVSNLGDNSLTVFDVATGNITATIPGVPGSRGLHGIGVSANSNKSLVGWVAGTDANVVTVVDLLNAKVLTQIPVSRPTAVRTSGDGSSATMSVASAGGNTITAYNRDTAQVVGITQSVPNPQDFVGSALGDFATIGGQDSLWRLDHSVSPSTTTIIPGVPGAAALATVNFGRTAPTSAVLVTSTNSNSVFLIQQQTAGSPRDFSVSNGASFGTVQAAPGSLASAFATTGVNQNFSATSVPLPKTLGGVTLSIGGAINFSAAGWSYSSTGAIQAPLLFVGPNQINFQIPPGIAPGSAVAAQLTKPDGTMLLTTLNLTATAPGIFTVLQNGQGQAAVLNQDNSQNGNPQSIVGANPAARGSVIQIYATGGGETTPSLLPGEAAAASGNPLVVTNAQPTVMIGGQQATMLFSGMAPGYVGLWQINAQIPQSVTPGNAVPLVVTAGGVASNTVTIAVQ